MLLEGDREVLGVEPGELGRDLGRAPAGPLLEAGPAPEAELEPGGERWTAAVDELKAKRLNAVDAAGTVERWAAQSRVLRLEPCGPATQGPGTMPNASHAAASVPM